jgi:hypothetical protein
MHAGGNKILAHGRVRGFVYPQAVGKFVPRARVVNFVKIGAVHEGTPLGHKALFVR